MTREQRAVAAVSSLNTSSQQHASFSAVAENVPSAPAKEAKEAVATATALTPMPMPVMSMSVASHHRSTAPRSSTMPPQLQPSFSAAQASLAAVARAIWVGGGGGGRSPSQTPSPPPQASLSMSSAEPSMPIRRGLAPAKAKHSPPHYHATFHFSELHYPHLRSHGYLQQG